MTEKEDCGPGSSPTTCRCRAAVERAFSGMIAGGAPDSVAMEAAARVFHYHHPECSQRHAWDTVETWLFNGPLH
jgi:hypothetical protein